jgi:sulfite reductase (NADPH) flavoprotein alpha-component
MDMSVSLLPENAPFSSEQRAWLNGFFAGLLGMADGSASAVVAQQATLLANAPAEDTAPAIEAEEFPWHDPALDLNERLKLAEDRRPERKLMAAMAQLDCGNCGYVCQTYAEAIANGAEKNLTLCSPGGSPTAKALKKIVKDLQSDNGATVDQPAVANGSTTATRPASDPTQPTYSRNAPFIAKLLAAHNLNHPESAKITTHVEIDLSGSGLNYRVGDSLGVWPSNCPELVEAILKSSGCAAAAVVKTPGGVTTTLIDALTNHCELREVTEELLELLLASTQNGKATWISDLLTGDKRLADLDVLDVLEQVGCPFEPAALVAALSPLNPRLYSIASSLAAHPEQVHLTVGRASVIKSGRERKGVASTMFSDRSQVGGAVRVYVQPNVHGFTVPDDPDAPIIMVGPGTGIAPFLAFLQERKARKAPGRNWLFFGDQRRAHDFLYEDRLTGYLEEGLLTRLDLAFSRDGDQKVYVQHLMKQNGAELFRWLEDGGYFYVCGDASRMAADVDRALQEIIAEHGGLSSDGAKDYVKKLIAAKRYGRDVY